MKTEVRLVYGADSVVGVLLTGVTSLLESDEHENWTSETDDGIVRVVNSDPVFLMASAIDTAIETGGLRAGAFSEYQCLPGADLWPARWRVLFGETQ